MNEIDLIPSRYRNSLRVRGWLLRLGVAYLLLLAGTGAVKAVLSNSVDTRTQLIERLQEDKRQLLDRQTELEQLHSRRSVLSRHLATLEQLRSGPPVTQIFTAIDRALREDVWFIDWGFMRAGEYVPVKDQGVNTGYFIIAPETRADGSQLAWQMATHMTLRAGATSHTALAEFVQRLSDQPEIAEIKIVNTQQRQQGLGRVVEFELAIIVSERGGIS